MSGAGLWERWVRFCAAEEDASALALVRIVACTTVAVHLAAFLGSGAARLALVHHELGGLGPTHGWLAPLGGASPRAVGALVLATLVAAVLGALGWRTRSALVLAWLGLRAVGSLNPEARGSYDVLLGQILFVLILSGAGHALSLDARRVGPRPAARWPRLLLVLQLGLLYFGGALGKASSGWVPGGDASALWFILQQPTWARFPSVPLALYPLTQAATTLVWLFELLGLALVWAVLLRERRAEGRVARALARVRAVEAYLLVGLAMHLGIELTMEVGPFSYASLALYPAALEPSRLAAWVEAAGERWTRAPRS